MLPYGQLLSFLILRRSIFNGLQITKNSEKDEIIISPKPPEYINVTKPSVHPDGPKDTLNQVWITPEVVIKEIRKAKKEAAPGPDGLPMTVYAEGAHTTWLRKVRTRPRLVGRSGE